MNNKNNILTYNSRIHAGYLHARGVSATYTMLSFMDAGENASVLEIGFGTGATLVKLASRNQSFRIFGIETSSEMLKQTAARLKFCGLKNRVELIYADNLGSFPFEDASMDIVFAESVFSIQETGDLVLILDNVARILKPGGKLLLNETIWLPDTARKLIREINQNCKESFGIIQANEEYPYPENWKQLIAGKGFQIDQFEPIKKMSNRNAFQINEWLSGIYTVSGKIKSLIYPSLRKMQKNYRQASAKINYPDKVLEGYLIVATKRT